MARSSQLPESVTREMVHLMSDVCSGNKGILESRRELLSGLAKMVASDCWLWALVSPMEPGAVPKAVVDLHGGFEGDQFARYLEAVSHPDMGELNASFYKDLAEAGGTQITRRRQDIVSEEVFRETSVAPLFDRANIGPLILSAQTLANGGISLVALYRNASCPSYSEMDAHVAHIILSEISWLHHGWAREQAVRCLGLMPREWIVMNLLVNGDSRKSISSDLGISLNTCNGYVKEIFYHFGVNSHPELIHKLTVGDGRHLVEY